MLQTERASFAFSAEVTINYEVCGPGPVALVLLHGYGASLVTWRDVIPEIAEQHRVYALDLKGFGLSSKPRDEAYSPDVHADIVAAFVRQIPEDSVVLVGNSYGGGIVLLTYRVLAVAEAHQRIRALVLIDAAAYPQRLPWYIEVMRWPLLNRLILNGMPAKSRAATVLRKAFANPKRITDERIARHAAFLDLPGSHDASIVVAQQMPYDTLEVVNLLPTIDVPTLILWGRQDRIIPVAFAERLHRDIRNSRLVILDECGHIPQEESPAETARHIREFIAVQHDET